MKKILFLFFYFVLICSLNSFGQKALTDEEMIRYLYTVYYNEGFKNGLFEPCLLEKTKNLCYRVLEEDSTSFDGNYYLSLIYYNEIARIAAEGDEGNDEKKSALAERYEYYSNIANQILEERQKILKEE